jgi:hypothetical protein
MDGGVIQSLDICFSNCSYLSTNIRPSDGDASFCNSRGSAPSDGDASFCVTPPSILTLYAIAGPFLRRLCLGLFYTVIGWPEFGDITTDGSHYGLDISRTGLQLLLYGLISTL